MTGEPLGGFVLILPEAVAGPGGKTPTATQLERLFPFFPGGTALWAQA